MHSTADKALLHHGQAVRSPWKRSSITQLPPSQSKCTVRHAQCKASSRAAPRQRQAARNAKAANQHHKSKQAAHPQGTHDLGQAQDHALCHVSARRYDARQVGRHRGRQCAQLGGSGSQGAACGGCHGGGGRQRQLGAGRWRRLGDLSRLSRLSAHLPAQLRLALWVKGEGRAGQGSRLGRASVASRGREARVQQAQAQLELAP